MKYTQNIAYPFGMHMQGRSFSSGSYRYGFQGQEKDDEVKGSGNSYDMGDRWLDVRLGRTPTTDRLAKETPSQSPYVYAGNNPILYIDKNGDFKLKYDEQMLKDNGLTKQDVVRFEQIVRNVGNLIKDNPQALEAISNTTGFSKEQILEHTEFGKGPTIEILEYGGGARGGQSGIVFDVNIIKQLSNIDPSNTEELATQTLGAALTVLHEYGHYGDQVTNEGQNTGQFIYNNSGRRIPESGDEIILGKQKWKVTATGHRGIDIEVFGFGVQINLDPNSKFNVEPGKSAIPSNVTIKGATIPEKLPSNAQGTNILKTLEVD
jgi:RHS repeat-associated protein